MSANALSGAKLVALESRNHILVPRDPVWAAFVREIRGSLDEGASITSRP
jgi:hypothetical protein